MFPEMQVTQKKLHPGCRKKIDIHIFTNASEGNINKYKSKESLMEWSAHILTFENNFTINSEICQK